MPGADKLACQIAALMLLLTLSTMPAKAQFGGSGGGSGGGDMMTQMAPMLNMMKAKMGKRRFGMMMQTVGPMASRMMQNGGGGFGGMLGGSGPSYAPEGYATGIGGGGDVMGALGGSGGGELMAMVPQLVQMASAGGGHRRHRRR
jgi:hypothetical protein